MLSFLGQPWTGELTHRRIQQARWGVMSQFFLFGTLFATFLSRTPSITEHLGVTPGEYALLMLAGATGALLALTVTGWAAARLGTRSLLFWSPIGYAVAFCLEAAAIALGDRTMFAAGGFLASFMFAFANVSVNAEAANIERWAKKPILPQFHAAFSVGMATGLGLGALVSHWGVHPSIHISIVATLVTVARILLVRVSVVYGAPDLENLPKGFGGPFQTAKAEYRERRVILIGLIVFASSTIEGAAANWASLAVVHGFNTSEAIGDLFYWGFVVAMVSSRTLGAAIISRLGRVKSLRFSALTVLVGVLLFAFGPTYAITMVGTILWGLGAGLGVPIGLSAASDDPKRAPARVAAVSSFSTMAGLVMPQVIGRLGDVIPLRKALLVILIGSVIMFLLARAVRSEGPLLKSHKRLQNAITGAGAGSDFVAEAGAQAEADVRSAAAVKESERQAAKLARKARH